MRHLHAFPLTLIVASAAWGLMWLAVLTPVSPAFPNLAWSPVRNLSSSERPSEGAVIAAFSDTIHVVWVETVYGQPEIYHTYRDGSNEWSTPVWVEAGVQPDLAVGPEGTFDLVWVDESGDFIRYRRWDSTIRDWIDAANVAVGNPGTLQSPKVAIGPGGASHVVWVDSVTGSPRLRHRRRLASGWDDPENVPGGAGTEPDVGIDADGEVHIVWVGLSLFSETRDIHYLWKDPQRGWSEAQFPSVLSSRQFVDNVDPSISIDRDGIVHVSWQESSGGTSAILHRMGRERNWLPGDEEVVRLVGRVEAPAIGVDEHQRVHLAFAGPEGIAYYTRSTRRIWQAGEPIAAGQPAATSPDLAVVGEETVHAVWTAPGFGGYTDIFYRGVGPGLEPMQTPVSTATSIATTTPTVTLVPIATSTATTPTPIPTSVATGTRTITLTPAVTGTPESTPTASPTSPTGTRTPSPAPTALPQHKSYLPLVLQSSLPSQEHDVSHRSNLRGP